MLFLTKKSYILYALLFFNISLSAKEAICYSVELFSTTKKNYIISEKLLQECISPTIGKYTVVRCGCYDDMDQAKESLKKYKNTYPSSYIINTYKKRFAIKSNISKNKITKQTQKKPFRAKRYVDVSLFPITQDYNQNLNNSFEKVQQQFFENTNKEIDYLESNSNLFGFFFEGKYDQYVNQNYDQREYTDYEYNLKLKFELFKNGYFSNLKKETRLIGVNKIIQNQDLIKLENFRVELTLSDLDVLLSKVNAKYYDTLHTLFSDALKEKKEELQEQIIPRYKLNTLKDTKEYYRKLSKAYYKEYNEKTSMQNYDIIPEIENLTLMEKSKFISTAKKTNIQKKLYKTQSKLLQEETHYLDDVSANVYTSVRGVDELGYYNTIGAEVKLPLYFQNQQNKQLQNLRQSSKNLKLKAIDEYIETSINNIYSQFQTLKETINIKRGSIQRLDEQIIDYELLMQNYLPSLRVDPKEEILKLNENILLKKYEIIVQQIELYKLLLELSALSNTPIHQLIKGQG